MRRLVAAALLLLAGAAAGYGITTWMSGHGDTAGPTPGDDREILYWTDPMLPDYRADGPGKSPMGMDLVPVYADGEPDDGEPALRIAANVVNNLGVRTATVERGTLALGIDTVGHVAFDDDRVIDIDVRVEGWVEDLQWRTEGASVRAGDLLFRLYSRPLVSAGADYLRAVASGDAELVAASAARLEALGMSPRDVAALRDSGSADRRIEVRAPQDGVIVSLAVREGGFVRPGTPVMRLADLSSVWVEAQVHENRLGEVARGQAASMTLAAAPGRVWTGRVDYVYPTVRAASRTGRVRLVFANPDRLLMPDMFAAVRIEAAPREGVLLIPREALIRTGRSERVILALGEGRFRPAEVRSGIESGDRVEILEGLAEGEQVVTSGQFLIDSEASLNASFLRMLGREGAEEHRHD